VVPYLWDEARDAAPSPAYLLVATVLAVGLILHWGVWLRRQEAVWKIALIGGGALVAWHGACLQMGRVNHLLGRQASVRTLAEISERHQPNRIFIYRARAAGYLFALHRNCWINPADADVVIAPSDEARGRFFVKPAELTEGLHSGQKVEGITLRHVFSSDFDPQRWQVIGRAGSFLLVRAYGE